MTTRKTVAIERQELEEAFEFASMGMQGGTRVWISLPSGKVCWHSDELGDGEAAPEDEEGIIPVPHKKELDLGRALVMRFAREIMPTDEDTIEEFFRRRGAYGRFENFLQRRRMLERWYEFEKRATEQAMLAWCEENDVELVDAVPGDDPH